MYVCIGSYGPLLYKIFTVYISSVALLAFNLTQIKKKRELLTGFSQAFLSHYERKHPNRIPHITTILAVVEIILISLFQHGLVSPLNLWVGSFFYTGANYFGLILAMPILLPAFCWLIGVNPLKQIDLITPAYPLALFFMKIGCFFFGCCSGIPCKYGIYNIHVQQIVLPTQLIEAFIALLLFFFLLQYRKKAREGTLFPMYILLYCVIRFFSEFLRGEPAVLFNLKIYQHLCLVGIFSGIVQLIIVHTCNKRISSIFHNNLPKLLFSRKRH